MKYRQWLPCNGISIIPFLFLIQIGHSQTQIIHHTPPAHGIIGQDLILYSTSLETTDPIDATLYYRLPGGESYQEINFYKTGFNWEVLIPGFALTELGLEYVVAFQFQNSRIASFPMEDPFNRPHLLSTIPPENPVDIGVFGGLPNTEVLILSPEPDAIVDQNSVLVAASFFNATNVDESTVRLLIDDVDVSGKMMLEDGILSYDPDKMETGNHTIEIQMKDLDQQDLSPVQWSFTFGTIQQNITKIIDFSGSANSRISTETVAGTPLNIAEITGKFSFDAQWAKLTTDIRLTSKESQYLQPQNRLGTRFSFGPILDLDIGDFYPRFNPFTIDGKRIRGFGLDADLKWVRLQFIQGELNREVHEQNYMNGGYQILTDLTETKEDGSKTYYLDRTGFAFKRKISGLKLSLDLFSKFRAGIHFLKIRDDTTSVNRVLNSAEFSSDSLVLGVTPGTYTIDSFGDALAAVGHSLEAPTSKWKGQKPLDNLVFGFNLGTSFDQKKMTLDFNWNMSLYNRDIWDSVMSRADLDTALDDSLDGWIGVQYDENGKEIKGSTKIDTALIIINPIKFQEIFIINTNMSPLVPIDINAMKSHPISSIINMPSSAFNIRLRGHYANNSFLLEYRQVGPEYISLANPFLRNNARQFTISDRVSLINRSLFLNFGFKHLDNKILRTTINPLNTNTFFMNMTFLPGPGMPSIIVNYQSIGKNNEKTKLDSVGSTVVDVREDSKAASNMMAITVPFTSGEIKQNLTLNMGNVTNLDNLIKKRNSGYLFPKTNSKTISVNLSSLFPNQLKTITQFSQTKLEIPTMNGNTLVKTPYTWTSISVSGNYRLLQDKVLAKGSVSLLNSRGRIKSQLLGFRAGADYRINENLSAALMSQIRLNYIPSYKKDNIDNDSDGKVDNASEVIDVNSTGIILTLQYNF